MKRDRSDEEDLNDAEVKKITQSNDIAILNQIYNRLSIQEREAFFRNIFEKDVIFKRFYGIPEDLLRIIAKMTPGTLMKLARTMDPFFISLAREDRVWQEMFRRDFPKDYEFCRGVLPFYVLEPTHPFYTPDSVSKSASSPWKRYYLRTAKEYVDLSMLVARTFRAFNKPTPGGFDLFSKSREYYRWIHEFILPKQYDSFDWRSTLVWIFMGAFVWYVESSNQAERDLVGRDDVVTIFIEYAKERPWMFLYPLCMYPVLIFDANYEILEDNQLPIHGPGLYQHELKIINRLFPRISMDRNTLFSKQDRGKLESFISTSIYSNRLNPAFKNVDIEARTRKGEKLLEIWDFLADCHSIPCIFGLSMVYGDSGKAYMARESMQIRQRIENIITENPTELLNLDMTGSGSIFTQRQLASLNIMNVFFTIQQSSVFYLEEARTFTYFFPYPINFPKSLFLLYSYVPRDLSTGRIAYAETCIQCGIAPSLPQQCGGTCERTVYCGVECQRAHWLLKHQKECRIK